MGYTTSFYGDFACTPRLKPEHRAYLEAFASTRRVKRDAAKAELLPDPIRIAAGLPVGFEGAYFVGGEGFKGQSEDPSVVNGNEPPGAPKVPPRDPTNPMDGWNERYQKELELHAIAIDLGLAQPGLWCQWTPNDDGTYIKWDEGEKFYDYVEWIQYIITHFLGPWGYKLNGECQWQGEESDDIGRIEITDNEVTIRHATISWS